MPRSTILIAAMLVAFLASACGTSTAAPRDATDAPDGAFWSADAKRGLFWKGLLNVLLQFSHLTTGADFAEATAAIGQAAMERVE